MKKLLANLFIGELLSYVLLGTIALVVYLVKQLLVFAT